MDYFKKLVSVKRSADRRSACIDNRLQVTADEDERSLHIAWLYPDVLNIHGGRGEIMGLIHVCDMLDMPVEVMRCDSMKDEIPFGWADVVYMNSGELKCVPEVTEALERQRKALDRFTAGKGMIVAQASTGAVLARETRRLDGSIVKGLGLLGMTCRERESVWGDDIWFRTDGADIAGNQIQVIDTILDEGQDPLGKVIYGRGNDGGGAGGSIVCFNGEGPDVYEGARRDNIIFTNCLGPLVTKNPEAVSLWLKTAAGNSGVRWRREIEEKDVAIERRSFSRIVEFIENKGLQKSVKK